MRKKTVKFRIWHHDWGWLSPDLYVKKTSLLHEHDTLVTKAKKLTFVIDYPVTHPSVFTFSRSKGWTVAELYKTIKKAYDKVFQSPAKHQVYGHMKRDLVVTQAMIDSNGIVRLDIDS